MMNIHKQRNILYKKAYAPYKKEAWYCFFIDIIICLVGSVIYYSIGAADIVTWFPFVFMGYLFLEVFFNYRLAVLSCIERIFNLTDVKCFRFIKISDAFSFSGKYGSVIYSLYPKELNMGSYKITAIENTTLKKVKLRTSVPGKKWQIISDNIYYNNADNVYVVYGKLTHIIIDYDSTNLYFCQLNS